MRSRTSSASCSSCARRNAFSSSRYSARVAGVPRLDSRSRVPLDPGGLEQVGQQDDQLGVGLGRVGADRLGAELPELPVAASLRRLGAEAARQVPELHGLGQLAHPVLEVGAADRRGDLRAQRQRAAAAVVERVHLLLHDVGGLPHPAREQLGRLERRRLDPPVAGGAEDPVGLRPRAAFAAPPTPGGCRMCREGPESQNAHRSASSRRNGLVARSRPSVVIPMWPG